MPLYEYTCQDCGTDFELRLKYEERLNRHSCKSCGGTRTLLRLSAPVAVTAVAASDGPAFCQSTGQPCGCGAAGRS